MVAHTDMISKIPKLKFKFILKIYKIKTFYMIEKKCSDLIAYIYSSEM